MIENCLFMAYEYESILNSKCKNLIIFIEIVICTLCQYDYSFRLAS